MKQLCISILLLLIATIAFAQDSTSTSKGKKKLDKFKPKISGMVQVHYMNEFNTNGDTVRDPDGFRILRARLCAKGQINKWIGYDLMIDPRSPEHSGLLRDAFIRFDLPKHQTLRVGQQKTQFGYENRQTISELYVVNRSELSDALSRGYNLRDIGIGLIGKVPLKKDFYFEDAITFTNGSRMNLAGPWEFQPTKNGFGRLGIGRKRPGLQWGLGVSGAMGQINELGDDLVSPLDDIRIKIKRLGTDLEIDHKHFSLVSEFAMGTDLAQDTLSSSIGYAVTVAGKTKWHVGPMARLDLLDDEYRRLTFGAYYGRPKDKFRVLINYEMRGGIVDIPGGHDDRLYVQCQVRF